MKIQNRDFGSPSNTKICYLPDRKRNVISERGFEMAQYVQMQNLLSFFPNSLKFPNDLDDLTRFL